MVLTHLLFLFKKFKLSVHRNNSWQSPDSERIMALSHLVLLKTVFLHCHQLSETCQFLNTGWQTCILLLPLGMSALFPYTDDNLIFICIYIRDVVVYVMGRISNSNLLLIWGPKSIEIDDSGTSQNLFWKSWWCVGLVHLPSMSHVVETTIHIKKYKSLFLSAYEFYILLWQKSHCVYSLECRTSFFVYFWLALDLQQTYHSLNLLEQIRHCWRVS